MLFESFCKTLSYPFYVYRTPTRLYQIFLDLKRSVFDKVFLKPDRTLEQRKKHKELVAELKQNIKDSPDKHHFIKNGEVCRTMLYPRDAPRIAALLCEGREKANFCTLKI